MKNRQSNLKNQIKKARRGKLIAWISVGSPNDNYGFGSNWNLNVGRKNVSEKSFFLGQGAKVTSRMLGVNYGDYVKHITEERVKINPYKRSGASRFPSEREWISDKRVNKAVTQDVVSGLFGDSSDPVTSKKLKKLLKAQSWDLAVQ